MKKVQNPSANDIPALKALWCDCYPEDRAGYCDFYFDHFFAPEYCLAVYDGTRIESALYMFDGYYKNTVSGKIPMRFLYAAATAEKYRRQGNFGFLLDNCLKRAVNDGCAGLYCIPYDNVVHLYERRGWRSIGKLNVFSFSCTDIRNLNYPEMKTCSFSDYKKMRNDYLNKIGNCFYWSGKTEVYMYEEIFTKGDVFRFTYRNRDYYAVCTDEGDRIIIRETNFPLDNAESLVSAICGKYSYNGQMEIYSRKDSINLSADIEVSKMNYGSYITAVKFKGSEALKNSYLNIAAD